MKKKVLYSIFILSGVFLSSCANRLVGTWNIDNYETTNQASQTSVLRNVGEIIFEKNGSAIKKVDTNFFTNASTNDVPLQWSNVKGKTVTLSGDDSDFAKTWIVITDKRKTQVWKATDGGNGVQTLELSKK